MTMSLPRLPPVLACLVVLLTGCTGTRATVVSQTFTVSVPASAPRPAHLTTFTLAAEAATVATRLEGAVQAPVSLTAARLFMPTQLQCLHAYLTSEGLQEDPKFQGVLRVVLSVSNPELWAAHNPSALTLQLRGGTSGTVWLSAMDQTTPGARPLGGGMGSIPDAYGYGSVAGISDTAARPTATARFGYRSKPEIFQAWLDDRERLFLALYEPALDQAVTGTIESLRRRWHGASTLVALPFVSPGSGDARWTDAVAQVEAFRSAHAATSDPERRGLPVITTLDRLFADLAATAVPGDGQQAMIAAATWNRAVLAALRADYGAATTLAAEAERADQTTATYRTMPRLLRALATSRGDTLPAKPSR